MATFPSSEGVIVKIEPAIKNVLLPDNSRGVEILWDDETEVDFVHETSLHPKGYRSPNGGIGIFIK